MLDRGHDLSLVRQAELLKLSRSSLYYERRPVPAAGLAFMRRIDALHLDYPFAGSRMLRDLLRGEGVAIGRERVATMMRRMGIEALYHPPTRQNPRRGTRSTRICCAAWRWSGRTKSGRGWPRFQRRSRWDSQTRGWTSLPFRWPGALSIWRLWWIGSAGGFWPSGCRSRWRSSSALRRSRRHWRGTAGPRSLTGC